MLSGLMDQGLGYRVHADLHWDMAFSSLLLLMFGVYIWRLTKPVYLDWREIHTWG
jgi:hypothetical protein